MTHEQIVVRVDPGGQVHAETVGMKGRECLDAIALLEGLLEARVMSSAFTPEYYEVGNMDTCEVDDELYYR